MSRQSDLSNAFYELKENSEITRINYLTPYHQIKIMYNQTYIT